MLKQRVITASILAPLVLAAIIYLPLLPFSLLIGFLMLAAAWEWAELSSLTSTSKNIYMLIIGAGLVVCYQISFSVQINFLVFTALVWLVIIGWVFSYPTSQKYWGSIGFRSVLGFVILLSAWLSLVLLKQEPNGAQKIILLLFMVWGADIGAYFAGRAWGNSKLAPNVSPGKTWAGAFGGLVAAMIIAVVFSFLFDLLDTASLFQWFQFALLGALIAILSIFGDLAESMLKRFRGIKDSGQLLPGHGGIMDRIDSLVAVLPAYTLFFFYLGRV